MTYLLRARKWVIVSSSAKKTIYLHLNCHYTQITNQEASQFEGQVGGKKINKYNLSSTWCARFPLTHYILSWIKNGGTE
jgi:hypothetical protein